MSPLDSWWIEGRHAVDCTGLFSSAYLFQDGSLALDSLTPICRPRCLQIQLCQAGRWTQNFPGGKVPAGHWQQCWEGRLRGRNGTAWARLTQSLHSAQRDPPWGASAPTPSAQTLDFRRNSWCCQKSLRLGARLFRVWILSLPPFQMYDFCKWGTSLSLQVQNL